MTDWPETPDFCKPAFTFGGRPLICKRSFLDAGPAMLFALHVYTPPDANVTLGILNSTSADCLKSEILDVMPRLINIHCIVSMEVVA